MVEKKEMKNIFSKELQRIKDKDLQEKGIFAWKTSANQEKWKAIDKISFTLLFKNYEKSADHTRRNIGLFKTIYDQRDEQLNIDFLIEKSLSFQDGIVFNKYAHSHEGKKCKRLPEAYIVHHCELINFQNQKNMGK